MSTSPDLATSTDSERRGQKRRRCDVEQGIGAESDSVFTQLSTWEIPPDVVADNKPQSPSPVPVAASPSGSVPIDLTDADDPIPVIIHDKRASLSPTGSTPEPLSAYTCPICLSPPTNATLIACGHVCCGQCLFTAVKSTMRRNFTPTARCPVCRAEILGWDGRGGGVIGLKMQVLYSL